MSSFPVGIAYYPLDSERQSFSDWYSGDIAADLKALADARFSLVRVFISWKFLEPQVGQYGDEADERLDRLVEAAKAANVKLIVVFFADDRLAELASVPWGAKRDPRTDSYLVGRQAALVQRVVNRLRPEEAVYGWELGNEAFISGFHSPEHLAAWLKTLRDAIREVDPDRPIAVPVDPETLFAATGVDPRGAMETGEYTVSHRTSSYEVYAAPGPLDSPPSTYLDSFLLRLARAELPVLVDDAGASSLDHSPAEEAAHVRSILYSALMNRASGVLLKRYRDVETEKREPYFRDPYEVLVGVADEAGRPKPAMAEVKRFAKVAAVLDPRRYQLTEERFGVLLPSERYKPLPSMAGLFAPRSCLHAYILGKQAHLPIDVLREDEPYARFDVIVTPSVQSLPPGTWERLREFVFGGGFLVLTFGGGDVHPLARELFGLDFLGDVGPRDHVSCRVAQPDLLGGIASFDHRIEVPGFAAVSSVTATVVATDASGSPLVTLNTLGQGRAAFVAVPVERALAQANVWEVDSPLGRLIRSVYKGAADHEGIGGQCVCDRPEVETALFGGEEDDILLLLNHVPEKVTAEVTMDRRVKTVSDVRGGGQALAEDLAFGVPLAPNGAAALRLTYE